jgi:hypothetical protein
MDPHTSEKLVISSEGEDFLYGFTQPPKTISFIEAFSAK